VTQGRYSKLVDVANVRIFKDAIRAVEGRSAPEAAFIVVAGEWGLGKTHLGLNYALTHEVPFVRLQSACTPHWVLSDWARELGAPPARSCEGLYEQLIGILAKNPRPVIFDEVEHALASGKVVDQIRGVVDATEIPCVLMGREFIAHKLKRHPAVWSRVSKVAKFKRMAADDMAKLIADRAGVGVDAALMERLLRETEGRMRLALGAADELKRVARGQKNTLTAADLANRQLVKAEAFAAPGQNAAPLAGAA